MDLLHEHITDLEAHVAEFLCRKTCRNGYTPLTATKPQNDATKRTPKSAATQHATEPEFAIRVLAAAQLAAPSCAVPTGVDAGYFIWHPLTDALPRTLWMNS